MENFDRNFQYHLGKIYKISLSGPDLAPLTLNPWQNISGVWSFDFYDCNAHNMSGRILLKIAETKARDIFLIEHGRSCLD